MNYLSPKKQRFITFIKDFTKYNMRPPTFIEIMGGLNIRSLGTVNWYVNELEKEGVLRRMRGKNGKRALSVLEQHINNQLPLLGIISAGYPLEVYDNIEHIDVPKNYINSNNYVLKVKGESMIDDHICSGDYVIIKKTAIANNGDTVVAIINNEATLKKYYLGTKGIELHPKNSNYDIIHIKQSDNFEINGVVLAVIRQYVENKL